MSGIDRYILRQLLVGMVLVTIGLSAILWLTQSLRFIEITVNKGASLAFFFKLTILILPNFLTVILPVSLFSVVLFTFHKMISDREIIALRAAGVSHIVLARPALYLAVLAMLAGYLLNLWLIPRTAEEFHRLQWTLRTAASNLVLQAGQFNQVSPGLTVYIRERNTEGELFGIIVNDERSPDRVVTLTAERGTLLKSDTGAPKVFMINGSRQQVTRNSNRLSILYFDNYAMEFVDPSNNINPRNRDVRERSLSELLSATEEEVGPGDYRQFRVEAHQRLVSPLYHFTFALLSSAFLLCGEFKRRGQGERLVLAITTMVCIQAAALGVSDLATRHLRLVPLIYLTPIIPALISGWALYAPSLCKSFPRIRSF